MHLRVLRFSEISRDFQLRSFMYQLFESLSCGYCTLPGFLLSYGWKWLPGIPIPEVPGATPSIGPCTRDRRPLCRYLRNWWLQGLSQLGTSHNHWINGLANSFKKICFKAWLLPPNTGCSCRYFPQKHNFGKGRWSECIESERIYAKICKSISKSGVWCLWCPFQSPACAIDHVHAPLPRLLAQPGEWVEKNGVETPRGLENPSVFN